MLKLAVQTDQIARDDYRMMPHEPSCLLAIKTVSDSTGLNMTLKTLLLSYAGQRNQVVDEVIWRTISCKSSFSVDMNESPSDTQRLADAMIGRWMKLPKLVMMHVMRLNRR